MATLYRKYRPQNFSQVVGQNQIKITLEQEIKTGKIAHAYLFCGPRAVGKTTLARIMAKALNCQDRKAGQSDPCNKCLDCREITSGRSLDIIEIDAASHTGVDHVREHIIANARVAPSRLKYKIFIIDEVHMLSVSAFNALLKVIEEPPEYVLFILCTTEVHKVPQTIISRCQRFDFKRIGVSDISQKLNYIIRQEGIKVGKSILEAIARQADGHMRDAESLLQQIVAISGKEITLKEADLVIPRSDINEVINLIEFLAKKDCAGGIRLVNKLVDEGVDLKSFLGSLVDVLRNMLLIKINPGLNQKLNLDLGENLEIKIFGINQKLSVNQLLILIDKFIKARGQLNQSFILQLPLELAIIESCALAGQQINTLNNQNQNNPSDKLKNSSDSAVNSRVNTLAQAAAAASKGETGALGIKQLNDKWHEVLAKVKQYNHSLSFILRVCQPRQLNNNQLCLAFKYKFHGDRVKEPNIKTMLEQVLRQVYAAPLTIDVVVDESLEISQKNMDNPNAANNGISNRHNQEKTDQANDKDLLDNLLKTFGGKIVK